MHVVGVAYVTGTLFFEVNDGLESVWLKGWIIAYQSVGNQKIPTRLVALRVCVLCAYAAIRMYCSTLIRNLISIS